MKKIYMILAAMTLLSMSLNAQTTYEKVTSSSQIEAGKKYILVSEDQNLALTATNTGSSKLAGEAVTINSNTVTLSSNSNVAEFTLGGSSNSWTLVNGGKYLSGARNSTNLTMANSAGNYSTWRLNNNNNALTGYRVVNSNATSRAVLYFTTSTCFGNYALSNIDNSAYSYAYLYVEANMNPTITASTNSVSMSAAPGSSATETVTVTGLNLTNDITYLISGTDASVFSVIPANGWNNTTGGDLTITYSPTAEGTHTATLTLSSTDATDVVITLNGTCSNDVTICDDSDVNQYLPVYGYYFDEAQTNQMLYPASKFTGKGMDNKKIKSITFYPTTYGTTSGINFYYNASKGDGTVTIKLANMPSGTTGYTDSSPVRKVPADGFKTVKTITVPATAQSSLTEWVFDNLEDDFVYEGGDLLIEVVTGGGQYDYTYFAGEEQTDYTGYYSCSSYSYGQQFLPKVTFTYEDDNKTATPTIAGAVDPNNENNFVITATGNGTVTLTVGQTTETGNGSASITVPRTDVDQTVTATATAQETGKEVSDPATETISVPKLVTADPVITYVVNGDNVVITATGNGTVNLSTSDNQTASGNGSASITVARTSVDQTITATATAQESGKAVSNTVTEEITVPELAIPVLTAPVDDSTVNVGTNTGSGVSKTINIKGNYLTQDLTVSISGTGFSISRDVTFTVTAEDANAGQDITVTYNGTNENATGTLTISSSEVSATVHLTASYAESGEITVANGTTANMYLPVYGSYYEEVQMNQMIYPASMLGDMEGKYITSITFYPASGTTSGGSAVSGIMFSGGKVMLSLGSTTNNSFTSNSAISATVTEVASITNVQQDANLTAWTFTFDTPYLYEGGNLLLQVDTEAGSFYRTFFYGTTMSNMGRHQCTSETERDNFLPKATFTYSSTAPLPPAVEGGLLRLHLLFCDQLKAAIPDDNSHPDAYGYVLRWEPQGEEMKESGRVKVNIQKTDCEVLSYYTLDQIDLDKHIGSYDETTGTIKHDQGLTMDVITAQVEFDLSSSNDMLNYYYLQGKEGGYPRLDKDYLSQLHRQENFTYREMWPGAPEFDEVYESGIHHYFNDTIKTGEYGSNTRFMSYAPSVTTWGIQRRYFELDGKDNTYGAPVWKTSVGKVRMQGTPVAERQSNANNSVNWTDENGAAASIYVLDNIEAVGNLPHTDKTKVKFEPYMFRVFVESENGLLRNYKVVGEDPNNTAQPGEHIEGVTTSDEDTRGPLCIWSGYVKFDEQTGLPTNDPENGVELSITQDPLDNTQQIYTFHKNKVAGGPSSENWKEHNAVFGALDALSIAGYDNNGQPILQTGINEKDLRVFVRFYYNVKGRADGHVIMGRAADADRPGNGSESPGTAPSPWTAVKEISYNGEVVSVTYVNSLGMQSDEPFEGVNIVVTRYSDGKVSTVKVIR